MQNIEVENISDARKEKINSEEAWDIISKYKTVLIGKGKKVLTFSPDKNNRDDILKAAMGRSGNLRAPTIKLKDKIIIGYNDEMFANLNG